MDDLRWFTWTFFSIISFPELIWILSLAQYFKAGVVDDQSAQVSRYWVLEIDAFNIFQQKIR